MVTVAQSYRTGMDLTDQQWTFIEPLLKRSGGLTVAAAHGATRVRCSTG